jgi:hypothetical protein
MLALILGIAAAAGWIIFDVAISVVAYPLMPPYLWWIFVLSGGRIGSSNHCGPSIRV